MEKPLSAPYAMKKKIDWGKLDKELEEEEKNESLEGACISP